MRHLAILPAVSLRWNRYTLDQIYSVPKGNASMDRINNADTAWVLISAALVMLMTPALGLFYGGLVRRKNVLATIMHSFFLLALISVQWVLVGYTLAFGPDAGGLGIIGGLKWLGLQALTPAPNADYAPTIPHGAFIIYQAMFAVITPALITGAFAERMRFKAFVLFSLLWATVVYDPIAHWVWGQGGWLRSLGALDFAGGTVVHISSGMSALVAAMVLGRRLSSGEEPLPHDATMNLLGAGLLWFGWFGFNAGSALAADGLAVQAFINTNTAAAMATLTWVTVSWAKGRRPSVLGAAAGSVAGLVAVTPAAGYVTVPAAMLIGLGAGLACFWAVNLKPRLGVDDALDVWGVHGVGGVWGALAVGIFATISVNGAGANGLLYGNPLLLLKQFLAVLVIAGYAMGMTWAILKFLERTVGLRVAEREEHLGLDASQHGEAAYIN